jgi:hypothetical protein
VCDRKVGTLKQCHTPMPIADSVPNVGSRTGGCCSVVEEYSLITESVTAVENVSDPEHTVNVECLAQTWDGSLWCGMGNGVVVRLDLETENCSRPLQAHRATVSCMVTTAT